MGFMDILAGLGPAISGVGAMVGGILQSDAQRDANDKNMAMAQQQMDFQERMSSSAYQRAMADMNKAGLNPMLAFSQGGASSPAGASPNIQPEDGLAKGMAEGLSKAVSTAYQKKELDKNLEQKDAEIGLTNAAKDAKASETLLNTTSAAEARKRMQEIDARMREIDSRISGQAVDSELKAAMAKNERYKNVENGALLGPKLIEAQTRGKHAERDSAMWLFDNVKNRLFGGILGSVKPW